MSKKVSDMTMTEVIAGLKPRGYKVTENDDGTFDTRITGMNALLSSHGEEDARRLLSNSIKDEEAMGAARANGDSFVVLGGVRD